MVGEGPDRATICAAWAVALYAATVPFQRLFQFDGIGSPATVAGALVVALGGFALLLRSRVPRLHPSIIAAGLLTAIIVGSLGYGILPTASTHFRVRGLAAADASKTIQLLVILGFMWLVLDNRYGRRVAAAGYVIGGYVAVGGNLVEWAESGFSTELSRISGSDAAQPNVVGLSMAVGIPLAWYALHELRNRPMRLLMAGYLVAGPVGILLTGSRTATTVGLTSLLIVLITFRQVPVQSRAVVMVVVVAGLLLLPGTLAGERTDRGFSGLSSSEGRELETRAELFDIALNEMAERPLQGSGRGVVREISSTTVGNSKLSSHNSFLNIGAEFGLIALGLYAAMWVLAAVTAFGATGMDRLVALTVLGLVVGGSMVVNFELEKANWFALGIALAIARPLPPEDQSSVAETPIGQPVATGAW